MEVDECRRSFDAWFGNLSERAVHAEQAWVIWRAAWIAHAPKVESSWQPIKTAPRDGTKVFGYCPRIDELIIMKWSDGRWVVAWDHDDCIQPRWWMPLPELSGEQLK